MPVTLDFPFTIFTDDGPMDGISVTVTGVFTSKRESGTTDTFGVRSLRDSQKVYYDLSLLDEKDLDEVLEIATLDYLEQVGT